LLFKQDRSYMDLCSNLQGLCDSFFSNESTGKVNKAELHKSPLAQARKSA